MEIINALIEYMSSMESAEIAGATIVGVLTAAITTFIATIVSRNKRLKNSVSKKDLEQGILDAKKYTDEKMEEHEKNQVIEINNMKEQIKDTHNMVTFLYQAAITKTH